MTIIENTESMLERMVEDLSFWWAGKSVPPPWKSAQRPLRNLPLELLFDPVTPLLGTGQKELKLPVRRPHTHANGSVIHDSQDKEPAAVLSNR